MLKIIFLLNITYIYRLVKNFFILLFQYFDKIANFSQNSIIKTKIYRQNTIKLNYKADILVVRYLIFSLLRADFLATNQAKELHKSMLRLKHNPHLFLRFLLIFLWSHCPNILFLPYRQ